ncbi:MAG TPA: hypothetical protein IAC66_05675 [Candidatus Aphodousia gallistercoris]|nr:hypothetical protein [Candidatus Aphodousia gallistercoris]
MMSSFRKLALALLSFFSLAVLCNTAAFAKPLLVYYSLSGNTERVAQALATLTQADVYRIETVKAYPSNFDAVVEQAREERNRNVMPEIKPLQIDLTQYETVFLGFPIWSSSVAQPVKTFLSQYSLNGKTVYPFCTHDGYGPGRSVQAILEYSPQAKIKTIFDIEGSQARQTQPLLETWLRSTGYYENRISVRTPIQIIMDNRTINAELNDSIEAQAFLKMLPVKVQMSEFGGREFYGPLQGSISHKAQGQLRFNDGDITYCPTNNTVAIFYSQSSRPNLTMRVIPIGKVLENPEIFSKMGSYQEVEFRLP